MARRTRKLTENRKVWRVGAVLILSLAALVLSSLPSLAAKEKLYATGLKMWGDTDKGVTYFQGDVVIVKGDLRITCQYAEIDKDTDSGKITGGLVLTDKGITIKADSLQMDLKNDKGTFTGNVSLIRDEEKDADGKISKEKVDLTCDKLVANTNKRTFSAQGNTKLIHTDFTATCLQIDFNENTEILLMTGTVHLVREKDELKAERVEVTMKEKKFEATGSIELFFEIDEAEDEEEETAKEGSEGSEAAEGAEAAEGTKEETEAEGAEEGTEQSEAGEDAPGAEASYKESGESEDGDAAEDDVTESGSDAGGSGEESGNDGSDAEGTDQ